VPPPSSPCRRMSLVRGWRRGMGLLVVHQGRHLHRCRRRRRCRRPPQPLHVTWSADGGANGRGGGWVNGGASSRLTTGRFRAGVGHGGTALGKKRLVLPSLKWLRPLGSEMPPTYRIVDSGYSCYTASATRRRCAAVQRPVIAQRRRRHLRLVDER